MNIFPFWKVRWTWSIIRYTWAARQGMYTAQSGEAEVKRLAKKYNVYWRKRRF